MKPLVESHAINLGEVCQLPIAARRRMVLNVGPDGENAERGMRSAGDPWPVVAQFQREADAGLFVIVRTAIEIMDRRGWTIAKSGKEWRVVFPTDWDNMPIFYGSDPLLAMCAMIEADRQWKADEAKHA